MIFFSYQVIRSFMSELLENTIHNLDKSDSLSFLYFESEFN